VRVDRVIYGLPFFTALAEYTDSNNRHVAFLVLSSLVVSPLGGMEERKATPTHLSCKVLREAVVI
jgi:hypothetical protein